MPGDPPGNEAELPSPLAFDQFGVHLPVFVVGGRE